MDRVVDAMQKKTATVRRKCAPFLALNFSYIESSEVVTKSRELFEQPWLG
jgi:hypothetical protein